MNKLHLLVILLLLTVSSYAQDNCSAKLVYVSGDVKINSATAKKNDKLTDRQNIKTGKNGKAILKLKNGSTIKLAPDSGLKLFCDSSKILLQQISGNIWYDINIKDKVNIESALTSVKASGSTFVLNSGKDSDRVIVIKGEIKAAPYMKPDLHMSQDFRMRDIQMKAQKVYDDMSAKKITEQEFNKRMDEIGKEMVMVEEELSSVTVKENYKTTIKFRQIPPEPVLYKMPSDP
jgi:hypothetical protein